MGYGLMLLRCTPMLLSAASINYDYNEWLFYHPFMNMAKKESKELESLGDNRRSLANLVLQHYVHEVFPPGFGAILVLYPLSWATTAAILTIGSGTGSSLLPRLASAAAAPLSRVSWYLYLAGCAFSFSHMLWGPRALFLMQEMGSLGSHPPDSGKRAATATQDDNVGLMEKWMRLHITRSIVADLPGFLCFTAAFLLSRPFR